MTTEKVVLGMDVGGTKTHAILIDTQGRVLGQGIGASANINFVTLEQAQASFGDAIGAAQKQAGLDTLNVELAIVGIEPEPDPLHPFLEKIAHPKKIIHKKEGECSLVGGLVEPTGVSLIAGTGSVGWGRNKQGQTHMTSCWGTIGDEGSAYDLARRGVNAAFWAADHRGPKTKLTDALCAHFKVKEVRDFVTPIYQNPDVRKNFAALSRIVMKVAQQNDPVAVEVIKQGAKSIALIISTCAEVLQMHQEPYRVAATGGLVSSGGWYFDLSQEELAKTHPNAKMVTPRFEPAIGAGLIGLAELGIKWDDALVKNLETSVKQTQPKPK